MPTLGEDVLSGVLAACLISAFFAALIESYGAHEEELESARQVERAIMTSDWVKNRFLSYSGFRGVLDGTIADAESLKLPLAVQDLRPKVWIEFEDMEGKPIFIRGSREEGEYRRRDAPGPRLRTDARPEGSPKDPKESEDPWYRYSHSLIFPAILNGKAGMKPVKVVLIWRDRS